VAYHNENAAGVLVVMVNITVCKAKRRQCAGSTVRVVSSWWVPRGAVAVGLMRKGIGHAEKQP